MFSIKNDNDVLTECRFSKDDNKRSCKEFENSLIEQNEEHLEYIKNKEESFIEKLLKK